MTDTTWRPAVGWRARLGILVIDKDTVPEVEFQAMAPAGVTVHTARFASPRQHGSGSYGADPAKTIVESPDIAQGLDYLGRIGLDAITLCFVTGSFFGGLGFDDEFARQAGAKAHGCRVGTAAGAVRAGLVATGVRRPFLVAPPWFNDLIAEHALRYFRAAGFDPAGLVRYDLGGQWRGAEPWQVWDGNGQQQVRSDELYRQVRELVPSGADGIAVLGNGLLAVDAVAPLEADLGVPVVTSNQAALWQCLRGSGVSGSPAGYGRLFDLPPAGERMRAA